LFYQVLNITAFFSLEKNADLEEYSAMLVLVCLIILIV